MLENYRKDTDKVSEVIKDGFILLTGGQDYITLDALEQNYINDVEAASNTTKVVHAEAAASPNLVKALAANAVPSLFTIKDGQVIGSFVGVASEEQVKAYLQTGVSPL